MFTVQKQLNWTYVNSAFITYARITVHEWRVIRNDILNYPSDDTNSDESIEQKVKIMNNAELEAIIKKAAEAGADAAIKKLRKKGKIKNYPSSSFKRTEEVLSLYPFLPEGNPVRDRINAAIMTINEDDYRDVIASHYFDGLTFWEISEIYDREYKSILAIKDRLIQTLARELFPEEVLDEIIG